MAVLAKYWQIRPANSRPAQSDYGVDVSANCGIGKTVRYRIESESYLEANSPILQFADKLIRWDISKNDELAWYWRELAVKW